MIFKINKDKQNSKTQRCQLTKSIAPSTADHKSRTCANATNFNITLHSQNKLLKVRRNSYINPLLIQNIETDPIKTISAKRMSLFSNRQRSKTKNCRSANNCYQKTILQQSNFDILKQQVKKLQEDIPIYALQRWKPSFTNPILYDKIIKQQNINILESIKKSKRNNMRKIIKGRPEIKKLLVENRQRILKQKIVQYTDQCVFTEQQDSKNQYRGDFQRNYQSVLHTIL